MSGNYEIIDHSYDVVVVGAGGIDVDGGGIDLDHCVVRRNTGGSEPVIGGPGTNGSGRAGYYRFRSFVPFSLLARHSRILRNLPFVCLTNGCDTMIQSPTMVQLDNLLS